MPCGLVSSGVDEGILLTQKHPPPLFIFPSHRIENILCRRLMGTVVHRNNRELGESLSLDTAQEFGKVARFVEVRNTDRDRWLGVSRFDVLLWARTFENVAMKSQPCIVGSPEVIRRG